MYTVRDYMIDYIVVQLGMKIEPVTLEEIRRDEEYFHWPPTTFTKLIYLSGNSTSMSVPEWVVK